MCGGVVDSCEEACQHRSPGRGRGVVASPRCRAWCLCGFTTQKRRLTYYTGVCVILTANLQFTLHNVFTAVVHRFAGVHSTVKRAGLAYLQGQDSLLTEHSVFGFAGDVHLVFVPGHFGLIKHNIITHIRQLLLLT